MESAIQREQDGATVRLITSQCSFTYHRPAPGVVHIQILGKDLGQFGPAVIQELASDLATSARLELFVDTSDVFLAVPRVAELWTNWFRTNQSSLKSVNILVRSRYVQLTVEVAKLFSRTGELIRIYLDPDNFKDALWRAATSRPR